MRRITRPPLPPRAEGYLTRKQQRIDGGGDAEAIWKSSRQTKTIREGVLGVLPNGRESRTVHVLRRLPEARTSSTFGPDSVIQTRFSHGPTCFSHVPLATVRRGFALILILWAAHC